MPTFSVISDNVVDVAADALVVAIAPHEDGAKIVGGSSLSDNVRGNLENAMSVLSLTGSADAVSRTLPVDGIAASSLVFVGVGKPAGDEHSAEELRRAAGAATRQITGVAHLALAFPTETAEQLSAVVEGASMGAYSYTEFKTSDVPASAHPVKDITVSSSVADADAIAKDAAIVGEAVKFARDLVNCPPQALYPESYAKLASEVASEAGITVTVLDDKQLADGGYGGLTGVGMASVRGPRLVKLEYSPKDAKAHVGLVGKGVTFDTGGISLKPSNAMEDMKCDMGGSAAVLGATLVAARSGMPVKVTTYLCLAENMPAGNALRPSDVITILGGKTVEVLNTDAEGRLVMADGLVALSKDNPDVIVDAATLTGAQGVALGDRVSAVMGDDEPRQRIADAAGSCGEQFWPMPLPREMRSKLDSSVADIKNIGDRFGGMLQAGIFLHEFIGKVGGESAAEDAPKIPFAHLDIASPAWIGGAPHGYNHKGGTGVGVRTIAAFIASYAK